MLDYHTGCVYPQDAASQLPAVVLGARPGEVVVDVCAAPGSKSTQIGLGMDDCGLLVACDLSAPRRRVLCENLARQGIACAVVTRMQLPELARDFPGCADAVLADVPCSGVAPRGLEESRNLACRQFGILGLAAKLAGPGGRVVYSTCTACEEENEHVVRRFLDANPGWTPESLCAAGCGSDLAGLGGLRLSPEEHGCEPFFVCRLRAPGDGPRSALFRDRDRAFRQGGTREFPYDTGKLGLCSRDKRDANVFLASREASACVLPAEAKGIFLGPDSGLVRPGFFAAQALIERGAAAFDIEHGLAMRLFRGECLDIALPPDCLVKTERGAPLGILGGKGRSRRLLVGSRLRRNVIV